MRTTKDRIEEAKWLYGEEFAAVHDDKHGVPDASLTSALLVSLAIDDVVELMRGLDDLQDIIKCLG